MCQLILTKSNREKCGKGITLNADEAAALLEALQKEVNSGD